MENQRQPASQPSDPLGLLRGIGPTRARRRLSQQRIVATRSRNVNARPHISRIHVAAKRKVPSSLCPASVALIPPLRPRQALESCGAPARIRGRGLYLVSVMIGLVARGALVVAPALVWGPAARVQG